MNVDSVSGRQCRTLTGVMTMPEMFNSDECSKLINTAETEWSKALGYTHDADGRGDLDLEHRNAIAFHPKSEDSIQGLWRKILNIIMHCNGRLDGGWGFDIAGLEEMPFVAKYEASDINKNGKSGHHNWHVDLGTTSPTNQRKLAYSVFLNPGEYEGGEIEFHSDKSSKAFVDGQDKIGTMFIFPAYMMHKVNPITKGTRYALVGWAHGDSFK